ELGNVAGDFLAPVPRAPGCPVAVVAAVEHPDYAAAAVAVVVVVAGEDVAESVQARLVVVPLAVGEDLELRAVAIHAERVGKLVGRDVPARTVDDIEVLRPLGVVLLDRAAAVAVSEVKLAVEAEDHAVHAVVGVDTAEAGQERVAFVGPVVTVGVLE